mmetsp:Transcript_35295/g.84608  ORF Transcript_35295/g.84608 Transcript_35295/m.84608 type:complete len:220 (+) Transcript_35295:1229-1888(+)
MLPAASAGRCPRPPPLRPLPGAVPPPQFPACSAAPPDPCPARLGLHPQLPEGQAKKDSTACARPAEEAERSAPPERGRCRCCACHAPAAAGTLEVAARCPAQGLRPSAWGAAAAPAALAAPASPAVGPWAAAAVAGQIDYSAAVAARPSWVEAATAKWCLQQRCPAPAAGPEGSGSLAAAPGCSSPRSPGVPWQWSPSDQHWLISSPTSSWRASASSGT